MQTEMLIGSKFEKGTEIEEQILNPKTGETYTHVEAAWFDKDHIEDLSESAELM